MLEPIVNWTAPAPFWPALTEASEHGQRLSFRRPAILGFANDLFMQEFMAVLANDPHHLGGLLARRESWREPAPLPELVEAAPRFARPLNRLRLAAARRASSIIESLPDIGATAQRPLKLYQPAHQRFYLVTACLVCRVPGLPDRVLDLPNEERSSFVIRRIRRESRVVNGQTVQVDVEHAMITTPRESYWSPLDDPLSVDDNEERLPLFGVNYIEDDGRRRRLLAGMIPVGRREHYMGAPPRTPPPPANPAERLPKDARETMLITDLVEPWKSLIDTAAGTWKTIFLSEKVLAENDQRRQNLVKLSREQIQLLSWLILADLAAYLKAHLRQTYNHLVGQPASLGPKELVLIDELKKHKVFTTVKSELGTQPPVADSLYEALKQIADPAKGWTAKLEVTTAPYDRNNPGTTWPDFLFPLADYREISEAQSSQLSDVVTVLKQGVYSLAEKVVDALPTQPTQPLPPLPLAARPTLDAGEAGRFVIRCVFDRPNCGPLSPPLLSEPSVEFQLAGFFDPEAPARPIRIALPIDTTVAGLRKFDKNTAFMISDVLACQIERARGITFGDLVLSVLPWPFHKDLPDLGGGDCTSTMGMICTLSIPIITICALILLIMIVVVLDIIFKWLPFFIACFPLPNFKAKR